MSRPLCARCHRPVSHCLCHTVSTLDTRTEVLILQHPDEARHALNTARLAVLGLNNAKLHVGERFEWLPALLSDPSVDSLLLFPGEEALPLAPVRDVPGRRLRLLVPDGTWRKARKLLYLNPSLAGLTRVALPLAGKSRYRLRKAPTDGALSTLEAIVAALEILEAPRRFDRLLAPFEALIQQQIKAMGEETYRRNYRQGLGGPDAD